MAIDPSKSVALDSVRQAFGDNADVVKWLEHPAAVRFFLDQFDPTDPEGGCSVCGSASLSAHDDGCAWVRASQLLALNIDPAPFTDFESEEALENEIERRLDEAERRHSGERGMDRTRYGMRTITVVKGELEVWRLTVEIDRHPDSLRAALAERDLEVLAGLPF